MPDNRSADEILEYDENGIPTDGHPHLRHRRVAFEEPEPETFEQKVVDAPRRFIWAATLIEACLGEAATAELDLCLDKGFEIVA